MDTLDGVRQLWKEYKLNSSEGAAMQITYENGEVKSHGQVYRDSDFSVCVTPVIPWKPADANGGMPSGSSKRNSRRK